MIHIENDLYVLITWLGEFSIYKFYICVSVFVPFHLIWFEFFFQVCSMWEFHTDCCRRSSLLLFIFDRFMMIAIHSNEYDSLHTLLNHIQLWWTNNRFQKVHWIRKQLQRYIDFERFHLRAGRFCLCVCHAIHRLSVSNVVRVKFISLGETCSYCTR